MKNIFVEGIQGSGKSTLINNIVKFNPELHVCREGDYSPIELAWCALMSKKEYEAVLQKYNSINQIRTLIGFHNKISYNIRHMNNKEIALLDDFLYEAIFIPEGVDAPPKEIINAPELQIYVQDFGKQEGDICFVAEVDKKIVGAVWVRNMDDYGHVEDGVPSFVISLYKEYRGLGIGTMLMKRMLEELKERGYQKTSLAVQKANYAVKMYKNVGFEIIDENEEEYIMMYVFR